VAIDHDPGAPASNIRRWRGGALVSRGTFGVKRAPKKNFQRNVGNGGREGKINAIIINQRLLRPTHG
jgi:hypothetical protein